MKNELFVQIIVLSILTVLLSVTIIPAVGAAPITGKPGSRIQVDFLHQDPDPGDAGKYIDLRWQVVNTIPGRTEELRFHLDAGYPFLFEAGDLPDKYLGTSVGTNDDKVYYVLHYKLRVADNALKGTYNVTLSWNSGDGWIKNDFPVYIDPSRAYFVIGALKTSPEKLVADIDEAKLSVNIDNIGDGDAENVKARLLLPEGFKPTYSYSDEDSLGKIEEGGTKQATFYIDINENIREGEYSAKLEISYRDENDERNNYRTEVLDLKIPIKPAPYLIIESVTSTPENLVSGTEAVVLIKVKNNGNEKAESVSLRVFKDASQPFDFNEKSDFIGKLEPGETGDAAIRFTVEENAVAKKHLMDVELRGIDEKENVVIFRRTVTINVNPEASSFPITGISAGLLFAAIGAVAVTFYVRNGKKNS